MSNIVSEALLRRARELESSLSHRGCVFRDGCIIEAVLREGSVEIGEDAVFAGEFSHLGAMKTLIKERVERLEGELRARDNLKPHFDAYDDRVYTGLYDFGHTAPDWEAIYRLGLPGLLRRMEEACEGARSDAQQEFCRAGVRVWSAALEYLRRMAEQARGMGKEEMAKGLLSLAERQLPLRAWQWRGERRDAWGAHRNHSADPWFPVGFWGNRRMLHFFLFLSYRQSFLRKIYQLIV